ncbi:MAG TPA: hypothetical protein ENK18_01670 [Deltaproteobacteria bacterium]|nr:hypothetical protein [Deltaproteobacteria bacterium]
MGGRAGGAGGGPPCRDEGCRRWGDEGCRRWGDEGCRRWGDEGCRRWAYDASSHLPAPRRQPREPRPAAVRLARRPKGHFVGTLNTPAPTHRAPTMKGLIEPLL